MCNDFIRTDCSIDIIHITCRSRRRSRSRRHSRGHSGRPRVVIERTKNPDDERQKEKQKK